MTTCPLDITWHNPLSTRLLYPVVWHSGHFLFQWHPTPCIELLLYLALVTHSLHSWQYTYLCCKQYLMSWSHSLLLISLLLFGLSGIRYSLNFPKGALASAIFVFHKQSSSPFSSGHVLNTSGAVVGRLLLTIEVVSGDDSELTDDISSLSDAFFLMSFLQS